MATQNIPNEIREELFIELAVSNSVIKSHDEVEQMDDAFAYRKCLSCEEHNTLNGECNKDHYDVLFVQVTPYYGGNVGNVLEVFMSNIDDTHQFFLPFKELSFNEKYRIFLELHPQVIRMDANLVCEGEDIVYDLFKPKDKVEALKGIMCDEYGNLGELGLTKGIHDTKGDYHEDWLCVSVFFPNKQNSCFSYDVPIFFFNDEEIDKIDLNMSKENFYKSREDD